MNRGTVVNLSQLKKVIDFLKANWCLLLITLLFLFGISFGVFYTNNNTSLASVLKAFSDSFINIHLNGSFRDVFLNSLFVNSVFYLLCFVFGTSVTGVTLVPIFVGVKGMLLGKLISDLYSEYSLKGIVFNALVIIPPSLISVVFLFASARLSVMFSMRVIGVFLSDTTQKNLNLQFNNYWKKQLLFFLPIIFSCILDAWISGKVINMLNL